MESKGVPEAFVGLFEFWREKGGGEVASALPCPRYSGEYGEWIVEKD